MSEKSSMNLQKNSHDNDPVLQTCHEIATSPQSFTVLVLRTRFDDLDLTERERTIVNTLIQYHCCQHKSRKQLTPLQTILVNCTFEVLKIYEDRFLLTPEGDFLAAVIDLWDVLEQDNVEPIQGIRGTRL